MSHSHSSISAQLGRLCPPIGDIHSEPFALQEAFLDLAARFATQPGSVLLYSGGELDCARHHILGIWPWLTLCAFREHVVLEAGGQHITLKTDPFTVLEQILSFFRLPPGRLPGPMRAGLMGYLSYDLKDCLEHLPRTSVDELGLPLMLLYAPSILVVQDRKTGDTRLMAPRPAGSGDRIALLERFKSELAAPAAPLAAYEIDAHLMASNFERPDYHRAVQRIIEYIAAGDVYQVNMSQRFQAPFRGNGFALFRRLAQLNPAPFFAYIQGPDHSIVSTSPERFLLQNGLKVEARPIKGTRPRCPDPADDAAMRRDLEISPKDEAELSMIVDLLRNDLGKVCRAGSVRVREHKRLEAYENVYHLVSIVEGELDPGQTSADLLKAAFPGGSITGCPKVRAMEIIDELETCRRHVYCGSIGYIGFDDTMDLSIAIRTATLTADSIRYSTGGGIVFDSQPADEYEETLHKGRTLLEACRAAGENRPRAEPLVWFNGSLVPARSARVDSADPGLLYGFGFFETIRVDQGHAPLLAAHVERFNTTWRALMPDDPPDVTWPDIIDQVVRANHLEERCAAVKLLATRGSRDQAPWDHCLLVTTRAYTHRLSGKSSPGLHLGTYPHARQTPLADYKTLNYLYYYKAGRWAAAQGRDEALILNPDGSVSETQTASLLLINGRQVIRPVSPAVLPGVMAGAVCRELSKWGYQITAEKVSCDQLMAAERVLATNALMGSVPVLSLDGCNREVGGDLWLRLNDAILPGWRSG